MTGASSDGPRLVIAGTFVLDIVAQSAAKWLSDLEAGITVEQAPYGQLLEALHDPAGPLLGHGGVNALVIRPLDWIRDPDSARYALGARAAAAADEVLRALPAAAGAGRESWLVAVPPPDPGLDCLDGVSAWTADVTDGLRRIAEDTAGMRFVGLDDLAALYQVQTIHDDYGDRIAHLPYTDEYLTGLGVRLARIGRSARSRARKLIVLDCDNTLWSGICGEAGVEGVSVTPPFAHLQRFMKQQRDEGKLLALCSRNNEADALAVFERPDMELRLTDVTTHRIGWGPKPAAVAAIARELGFGLDTVVFVDDEPVECAAVGELLPEVAVVAVPRAQEDIAATLAHAWAFDQFAVTEDDRLRADRYRQEARRRAELADSGDYAAFLRSCHTEVRLQPLEPADLERAGQLTTRTTQFNLTCELFTEAALRSFLRHGEGWAVRVGDRFGDYGTVGLVLVQAEDPAALTVRLLLMSCRVLNRGVETQILAFLRSKAAAERRRVIRLPYRATGRNEPARLFLERLSGAPVTAGEAVIETPAVPQ